MKISNLENVDLKFLFLSVILLLLFIFTRLYKIETIPASVYWDEASIGYNAYSIANTFKDEWGERLPLHFRAFGEFKLPAYIYSVAIIVKLFGLNIISIRAPSVFFSLLTIITVGLIVYEFFKNKWLSLLASLFLIISPWLFIFSRTGYEVTVGLAFFALAFYLFLISLKKSPFFLFSVFSLIVTIYSYNSFRIISPLTLLLYIPMFFVLNKDLKKTKIVIVLISFTFLLVSLFPIYRLFTKDFGLSRYSAVRAEYWDLARNYLTHFSPNFLLKGDINPRSQIPGFGQIWLLDIPLFLLGILFLIKEKKPIYFLPLLIFLISFIPASLTKESPHALRSLNALIFFDIILIFGIKLLLEKSKRFSLSVALLVIVNSLLFANYFGEFTTNYSSQNSEEWQYGYKVVFDKYDSRIKEADKVIISDKYTQPYIFTLFYMKVNPRFWRSTVKYNPVDKWGISTVASFEKFEFRESKLEDLKKGYLIFASKEIGGKLKPNDHINFLNGEPALFVYE